MVRSAEKVVRRGVGDKSNEERTKSSKERNVKSGTDVDSAGWKVSDMRYIRSSESVRLLRAGQVTREGDGCLLGFNWSTPCTKVRRVDSTTV